MKFCPKCGSLMLPKKDGKSAVMHCANCKHTTKGSGETKIQESIQKKEQAAVVEEDIEESTLPTAEAECEKCGCDSAYYWLVQTRASDEPATKFLRCTKCKHTWRDYT